MVFWGEYDAILDHRFNRTKYEILKNQRQVICIYLWAFSIYNELSRISCLFPFCDFCIQASFNQSIYKTCSRHASIVKAISDTQKIKLLNIIILRSYFSTCTIRIYVSFYKLHVINRHCSISFIKMIIRHAKCIVYLLFISFNCSLTKITVCRKRNKVFTSCLCNNIIV